MLGFCLLSKVVFVIVLCYSQAIEDEPTFSKFKYDKQMLETTVRMEAKMDQWDKERKTFEESMLSILEHRREEMQDNLVKQNKKQERELHNLRDKLNNVTAELKHITDTKRNIPVVAFNAYTTVGGYYGDGEIIIFPNVFLNVGNGYNNTSGYFTAPVTGLYQFTAQLCHHYNKNMIVAIAHEDRAIAKTIANDPAMSSCNSVNAMILAKAGETVSIMSLYPQNKMLADNYRWPSFNGVLINVY